MSEKSYSQSSGQTTAKPNYSWDWIGGMHIGYTPERIRIEGRGGAVEYTPDSGTCRMVECTIDHGSRSWGMRCTACGKEFEHMKPGFGWRFCPMCGAEVGGGSR